MLVGVLIAAALLIVIGAWLLIRGAVGRRVNDHPICRGCGFDLVGLYERTATGQVMKCPECGRELSGARGVRIGARRRSGLAIAVGVVMLAVGAAPVGMALSGTNWRQYLSPWALITEWKWGSQAAMEELLKRLWAGRLDTADTDSIRCRACGAGRS